MASWSSGAGAAGASRAIETRTNAVTKPARPLQMERRMAYSRGTSAIFCTNVTIQSRENIMIYKGLFIAAVTAAATVAWAQEPKDAPSSGNSVEPQPRGVISDNFGYTFTDSAAGNCALDFIDISGTGAEIVAAGVDDGASAPISIGTDFDFYGTAVTQLVMASNGYLSTDPTDTGPDLSNDCPLPAVPSSGSGARIYPLNDDLIASGGGFYEYFASCPRSSDQFPFNDLGCHVFQWEGATHFGGGGPFTFQVVLYDESS